MGIISFFDQKNSRKHIKKWKFFNVINVQVSSIHFPNVTTIEQIFESQKKNVRINIVLGS